MARKQNPQDVQRLLSQAIAHNRLQKDYEAATERLAASYKRTIAPLQQASADLTDRIAEWADKNPDESLTAKDVRGWKQYAALLALVASRLGDFSAGVKHEAGALQAQAVEAGITSAGELASLFAGGASGVVNAAWQAPQVEELMTLFDYVDSAVFKDRAAQFGEIAAEQIGEVILSSVSAGRGPRTIASTLDTWLAVPYSWGVNTVSTVQMYAYRNANIESYRANPQVVEKWVWWAALDERTCPVCLAEHGTIHDISETLDGHYSCRCTPVPVVVGSTWQDELETGTAWFDEQSPAVQKDILGAGKYDLYKSGDFDWSKVVQSQHDDLYGVMKREATLEELSA